MLKKSARDIRDKYVEPPYTTNFGILFLPFEGLYAEVVNMGMIETLQKEYGINVAGPSTMAGAAEFPANGLPHAGNSEARSEVCRCLAQSKRSFPSLRIS